MNWRLWVRGLVAALINGAANSVTVVIVDPVDFNLFQGGFMKLASVSVVSAFFGGALYLQKHPLPE